MPEYGDELVDRVRSTLDWVVTGYSKSDKDNDEVEFHPFSRAGDSGALVYTNNDPANRTLVGIVRADDAKRARWTFVTPIEFIYEDIKLLTGAAEVRLKLWAFLVSETFGVSSEVGEEA